MSLGIEHTSKLYRRVINRYFVFGLGFTIMASLCQAQKSNPQAEPMLDEQNLRLRVFAPQVSPDGRWLAYEEQTGGSSAGGASDNPSRNLRVLDLDSNQVLRIKVPGAPFARDYHGWCQWRPLSKELPTPAFAFIYNQSVKHNHDICLAWLDTGLAASAADGSDLNSVKIVKVTDDPSVDYFPFWSADGKTLLFLSSRGRERGADLYAVKAEDLANLKPGSERLVLSIPDGLSFPCLSPAGDKVAFTTMLKSGAKQQVGIAIQKVSWQDGYPKPEGVFVSVPTSMDQSMKIPSWSPDGKLVAFYLGGQVPEDLRAAVPSLSEEEINEIGVVEVVDRAGALGFLPMKTTAGIQVLDLRENSYTRGPVWLPGTHKLAFLTRGDGNEHPIVVWNADTKAIAFRFEQTRVNRDVSAYRARDTGTGLVFTAHQGQMSNIFSVHLP